MSFSLSLTFCSFVGQVAYELHRELEKLRAAVLREAREKEEERRKEKQEKVERWREEMEAGEEEEEEKVEELKREASLALKPREVFYFLSLWKCFTLLWFACSPTSLDAGISNAGAAQASAGIGTRPTNNYYDYYYDDYVDFDHYFDDDFDFD